jgi:uncharacterized iron-regulated protein
MHFPRRFSPLYAIFLIAGCAINSPANSLFNAEHWQGVDALLVGEQHDAPEHQRVQRELVLSLAARRALASVVVEMAERGASTAALSADASEQAVQAALRWPQAGWDWAAYAPVVMAAVRAGVPVQGGNLPRAEIRGAMQKPSLQEDLLRIGGAMAVQTQMDAVREGHCNLLPASQLEPMLRVQVARDQALAQTVAEQVAARPQPDQLVLMIAGAMHVDARVGAPLHLPSKINTKTVQLAVDTAQSATKMEAADRSETGFNARWTTAAPPPQDYCAQVKAPVAK